jgi:class 3 adenylate cyclase
VTILPQGTVTFVFTDIEGSTELLKALGDGYGRLVTDHRLIVREEFGSRSGTEIDTQGDAFFYSFGRARDAVAAAVAVQRRLAEHDWPEGANLRVRMSLHTGEPVAGEEGYIGIDVVRAARICSAGHGGQVLLSAATAALVGGQLPDGVSKRDLGEYQLKDLDHPERIYQLDVDGLQSAFPPLRSGGGQPLDFDKRLEARIQSYVERQLERAFGATDAIMGQTLPRPQVGGALPGPPGPPGPPAPFDPKPFQKLGSSVGRLAAGGLAIAAFALLLLAGVVIAIILLVKLAL